jgi:hypothetical protein
MTTSIGHTFGCILLNGRVALLNLLVSLAQGLLECLIVALNFSSLFIRCLSRYEVQSGRFPFPRKGIDPS